MQEYAKQKPERTKKRKYILAAALILSVILHGGLLWWLVMVKVPDVLAKLDKTPVNITVVLPKNTPVLDDVNKIPLIYSFSGVPVPTAGFSMPEFTGVAVDPGTSIQVNAGYEVPSIDVFRSLAVGNEKTPSVILSNASVPIVAMSWFLGFDLEDRYKKGDVVGFGRRTTGRTTIAFLDIPEAGEFDAINSFINDNTQLQVTADAAGITFQGRYRSFSHWLLTIRRRPAGERIAVTRASAPVDALHEIENALPYVTDNQVLLAQTHVTKAIQAFFAQRFKSSFPVSDTGWVARLSETSDILEWERLFLPKAEISFRRFVDFSRPDGTELKDLYQYLRLSELMRYPILFYDPQGVPITLLPENMQLLQTYVTSGGFLCVFNSADLISYYKQAMADRGFFTELLEETLSDPAGDLVLKKLQKEDRTFAGYIFRDPSPPVFQEKTFFSIELPRTTALVFSVFDKNEQLVHCDTLRNLSSGLHNRRYKDLIWYGTNNDGVHLPSGFYVYRLEADLARKTGGIRMSSLRKLKSSNEVFTSFYTISSPPQDDVIPSVSLPEGEQGIYGVQIGGRLALLYEEGYRSRILLSKGRQQDRVAALRWITNIIVTALDEGSLAR